MAGLGPLEGLGVGVGTGASAVYGEDVLVDAFAAVAGFALARDFVMELELLEEEVVGAGHGEVDGDLHVRVRLWRFEHKEQGAGGP
jgi:hypothetical protein